jgi:hypothetical protein
MALDFFFVRMLDLAEDRGYSISWGTEAFSVRAFLPQAGRSATFAYGWPAGVFNFYFGHLPLPAQDARAPRRELMEFGVFRETGKKTLAADLVTETLPKILEVYDFILEKLDEIVKRY